MSYDVYLLPATNETLTPEQAHRQVEARNAAWKEHCLQPQPLDPVLEARKRRLADLLLAADPSLRETEMDYPVIAQFEGTSEETARLKYRHIELTSSESRMQCHVHDDCVIFFFSFVANPNEMERCLRILCEAEEFAVYDPQRRVVDYRSG